MGPGCRSVALLLLLGGCGEGVSARAGGPRPAFDPGPVPPEHVEGEALFLASCSGCHGRAGTGFSGGPPLLDTLYLPHRFADSAIRWAVLAGAPSRHWDFDDMPAVRTVRPDQVPAVVDYVRWIQRRWVEAADTARGAAADTGRTGDSAPAPR
jgi:mono/diheme cytochrome c family protein